jgi:hypothetical protein
MRGSQMHQTGAAVCSKEPGALCVCGNIDSSVYLVRQWHTMPALPATVTHHTSTLPATAVHQSQPGAQHASRNSVAQHASRERVTAVYRKERVLHACLDSSHSVV